MSDIFNQLYYVDVVLSNAGANSQGNTVIIPKIDLDLTAILAAGKCRSDYADVSLAYKDNGGYTELDRQIWSPQYNWGGIKFDLIDDIVNIFDYRIYYGESGLTVPNKADPANVGYWSDDCNEDQSYTEISFGTPSTDFAYDLVNNYYDGDWYREGPTNGKRMYHPIGTVLDFTTNFQVEFLFNASLAESTSICAGAGAYDSGTITKNNKNSLCMFFARLAGSMNCIFLCFDSSGVQVFVQSKISNWALDTTYRVRIEHDATALLATAEVYDADANVQLDTFSRSTDSGGGMPHDILLNSAGLGNRAFTANAKHTVGWVKNVNAQAWREIIDGLLVVLSVGAEQNNPATSSDGVVFSDSDNRVYTGRGSSLDEFVFSDFDNRVYTGVVSSSDGFKLGDSDNSGFYIYGSCLDGIKLSDVVNWFKPPRSAPWYGWEEEVGVELELEEILLVYINFDEYTRAGIVDSKSFQSYLKMEEDLVSNLVKKVDGGTSNIKMN